MKYQKEDIERIRQLIAAGECQLALEALFAIAADDARIADNLVLLDSRLAHLDKSILEGTIARDDEIIERNTINRSLLALLKVLEQEPKPLKKKPAHVPKAKSRTAEEPVVEPAKKMPAFRRIGIIGGLLLLLLSAWGIGTWVFTPRESPEIRDLTARLVLRPAGIPIPEGVEGRLKVGEHLSVLQQADEDGVMHFKNTPVGHPADSVQLQLSGLDYPGAIVKQSTPNFKRTDSITFFYDLELIKLNGTVVHYVSLKPVPGIEIELEGGLALAVTDAQGRYSLQIPKLPKKSVTLVFKRNNKVVDEFTQALSQDVFELLKIRS